MIRNWNAIKEKLFIWQQGLIPGSTILAIILVSRMVGILQPLEWFALDVFLRMRPAEIPDSRIVIVGINEEDLKQIGSYPIPDLEIAKLLTILNKYQPRVIGLDLNRNLPIEPGSQDLKKVIENNENIIVIEKVLPPKIPPPEYLPPEQLGFSDAILDADGRLRRVLLGTFTEVCPENYIISKNTEPCELEYKFSLSLRLAEVYLAAEDITLENGIIDGEAMRFGDVELPRFLPNSGGYVRADAGGVQMLINFRSGPDPFAIISLEDIKTENFSPDLLKNKIVIIGIMSPAIDQIHSSAISKTNHSNLIHGVEIHAYSSSQMISAVKDRRNFIYSLNDLQEYLLIIFGGLGTIFLSRIIVNPWKNIITMIAVGMGLIVLSYVLLWQFGLWFPLVPLILLVLLNGTLLTAFYQHDLRLRTEIEQRQLTIDKTFDAIHNGPLQSLAQLLRNTRESDLERDELVQSLENLNKEIRTIYESMLRDNQENRQRLKIGQKEIDLDTPLHELLYEVYFNTLTRDFPYFKTLKVKIRNFEPIDSQRLTAEQKQGLCRFLEEALCNVGKYATNATRLNVVYTQEERCYILRITDNGEPNKGEEIGKKNVEGRGTRQAKSLAKQLKGKFQRYPACRKGTVCELRWPVEKVIFKKRK